MATPQRTAGGVHPRRTSAERRQLLRLATATLIGAIVTAFALLNLHRVKVDWLVAAGHAPLILVIVVAFALGIVVDRLLVHRRMRRHRSSG